MNEKIKGGKGGWKRKGKEGEREWKGREMGGKRGWKRKGN